MVRRLLGAGGFALLLMVPSLATGAGPLDDPEPGSPSWFARSVADYERSQERGLDMQANPDYQVRFLPLFTDWLPHQDDPVANARINTDPFRLDWGGTRGTSVPISYVNRYGARISGHLWIPHLPFSDPVTGATSTGPLPAVVMVNGYGSGENNYWGIIQGLAEAGYLVMAFDPQGQGLSEMDPNPTEVYCDPNGSWRDPQEMGIQEQGPCAGIDPFQAEEPGPLDSTPLPLLQQFADLFLNGFDYDSLAADYEKIRAKFVFGALDAVEWLLSDANPHRALVDATRIGVAGHSAGADGALHAGNGDLLKRFSAAVTFDGYGRLLDTAPPRIPTMFQHAEQQELGPKREAPDPEEQPGTQTALLFAAHDVDTAAIVLRGSTHREWDYTPQPVLNPFCTPFCNASRIGQRVALYYTVAWFDRYLKGRVTSLIRGDEGAQSANAFLRLTARVFDESVDGSSIGVGAWDPLAIRNVPYTISGGSVHDSLSLFYRSFADFNGFLCEDVRAGC